ncbi:collagen-like protein [Streptomyces meridianus]|uniref:Collagen-like protein n=1 Tax=Streptomyces meridianus TaxID=2938945 RepID=A0ABT0XD36_9ACTN|nr:collagen-like protein [Streptomyces meridianus]MCM2580435.1 collagen-like protein [Streptomyces meridianus]
MTNAQRILAHRWRPVLLVCTLIALTGAVLIIWGRLGVYEAEADGFAAEADRRGTAVSTLAGDVRRLRTQLEEDGKTPVAPDPEKAVRNLPARAEVPVPIPGARGEKGDQGEKGEPGKPAPTITPSPGASGQSGRDGVDGQDGAAGQDGQDGQDGSDGAPGSPPSGWSWTDRYGDTYRCSRTGGPDSDPQYDCEQTGSGPADPAPEPEPTPSDRSGLLGLAVLDRRKNA